MVELDSAENDGDGSPTAIVTGVTSGLGRATAQVLVRRGVNVVVGARRSEIGRTPEEAAKVLVWLCHPDGDITGATIAMDRGMSAGSMASTMIYMTSAGLWDQALLSWRATGGRRRPASRWT